MKPEEEPTISPALPACSFTAIVCRLLCSSRPSPLAIRGMQDQRRDDAAPNDGVRDAAGDDLGHGTPRVRGHSHEVGLDIAQIVRDELRGLISVENRGLGVIGEVFEVGIQFQVHRLTDAIDGLHARFNDVVVSHIRAKVPMLVIQGLPESRHGAGATVVHYRRFDLAIVEDADQVRLRVHRLGQLPRGGEDGAGEVAAVEADDHGGPILPQPSGHIV